MSPLPFSLVGAVTAPPLAISLTAVFLGGLSGAIFAVQRKFAITGVLAIAIATGLGGGIIRDLLLGRVPVALTDPCVPPARRAWRRSSGSSSPRSSTAGSCSSTSSTRSGWRSSPSSARSRRSTPDLGARSPPSSSAASPRSAAPCCATCWPGRRRSSSSPAPSTTSRRSSAPCIYVAAWWTGLGIDKVVAEWVTIAVVFGLRMLALRYGIKAPEPVDVPRHVRRRVLGSRRSRRHGMRVYRAGGPDTAGLPASVRRDDPGPTSPRPAAPAGHDPRRIWPQLTRPGRPTRGLACPAEV